MIDKLSAFKIVVMTAMNSKIFTNTVESFGLPIVYLEGLTEQLKEPDLTSVGVFALGIFVTSNEGSELLPNKATVKTLAEGRCQERGCLEVVARKSHFLSACQIFLSLPGSLDQTIQLSPPMVMQK